MEALSQIPPEGHHDGIMKYHGWYTYRIINRKVDALHYPQFCLHTSLARLDILVSAFPIAVA